MSRLRSTRGLAAILLSLLGGCASAPAAPAPTLSAAALAPTPAEPAPLAAEADAAPVDPATLEGLPPAPWSAARVEGDAVPGALLLAWSEADNRTQCAPLAPTAAGSVEGARARVSSLVDGGWAVEFDQRGLPGIDPAGAECRRCGRGVFGIAGTRMTPEELAGEADAEVPAPSFADGSHLAVEAPAPGESVAAATLTVRGQGCVYQVWSFLGEEHVRELVGGLRLVAIDGPAPAVATR